MDLAVAVSCLIVLMICVPSVSQKAKNATQLSGKGTLKKSPLQLKEKTDEKKLKQMLRGRNRRHSESSRMKIQQNYVCGHSNTEADTAWLVMNGTSINPTNKYPWLVSLYKLNHKSPTGRNSCWGRCGGVLISLNFVLTSARCVFTEDMKYEQKCLDLGDRLRPECYAPPKDICLGFIGRDSMRPGQYRRVTKIIPHPRYSKKAATNDIALLRLDKPARLNEYSRPICLPGKDLFGVGAEIVIAGTGYTGQNRNESEVQPEFKEDTVRITTLSICKLDLSKKRQLCVVRDRPGEKVCLGDSGSSVFQHLKGKFYAVGVTSYSTHEEHANECPLDSGTVFTKVSAYMGFITKHVYDLLHPPNRHRDHPHGNRRNQSAGTKLLKRSDQKSGTKMHKNSGHESGTKLLKNSGHGSFKHILTTESPLNLSMGNELPAAQPIDVIDEHYFKDNVWETAWYEVEPSASEKVANSKFQSDYKMDERETRKGGNELDASANRDDGHIENLQGDYLSGNQEKTDFSVKIPMNVLHHNMEERDRQRGGNGLDASANRDDGHIEKFQGDYLSGNQEKTDFSVKIPMNVLHHNMEERDRQMGGNGLDASVNRDDGHIENFQGDYLSGNQEKTDFSVKIPMNVLHHNMEEMDRQIGGDELDASANQQEIHMENLQGDYLSGNQQKTDFAVKRPTNVLHENPLGYNSNIEQAYLNNIIPHDLPPYDEPIEAQM